MATIIKCPYELCINRNNDGICKKEFIEMKIYAAEGLTCESLKEKSLSKWRYHNVQNNQ